MLSTIKDKLLNVTQKVPLFNNNNCDKDHVQSKVNRNAGCDILIHYQNEWEIIHKTNEENAGKADEAAKEIANITNKIYKDKQSLELMTHLLVNSNLKQNIGNCSKRIEELYSSFNQVEEDLLKLENIIDEIEFENMKKQHRYHLQKYKVRKEEALKIYEASLKEKHDKGVAELEVRKQKELEERQRVFHEAFKNDLELFKNLGTIPKLDLPKKQPSALLEEIQVDYDEKELDQFFEDNSAH